MLGILAMQWLRYPKAQVVFFDKDRTARAATMAVGGSIYEPGNEDRPVAFQPLVNIDQKSDLNWAEGWIETLMDLQNLTLTPKDKTEIHNALQSLATSPRKQRTIGGLQQLIQNQDIRDALMQYTLEGTYGQLFDSDNDTLQDDFWTMIEMGSLMDLGNSAIVPALGYLFYRIEQRFDGRPTLLILDEAWLFMDHPFFATRLRQWLKTLRKKNVFVVFATQEIEDAINSPICSTLLSACMTKIFLPDNSATDPLTSEAYTKLGLSETEIINLSRAVQKKEYFYRSPKGKRLFDLELGDVALAFVGRSSPSDQAFMDDLEKNHSSEQWAELLLRQRNLTWAADMVSEPLSVAS
ncbi:Conjugative transfer protein TrbE [methanotrophic endosymbiont of Bathymodiolus azoricus (Menez Gwen)]|nr:Conjugative transfer protein TrbE [methanotrophic endosymbiont of Bathymodiolus azoricus (Menez Gwen)]